MRSEERKSRFIFLSVFLIMVLFMVSCSGDSEPIEEENTRARGQAPGATEIPQQVNTSGTEFEESELPDGFPEEFPIPDEAKIGSSVDIPGENSFRFFLTFIKTLDEVLFILTRNCWLGIGRLNPRRPLPRVWSGISFTRLMMPGWISLPVKWV